jgi:hypothetical protein
MAKLNWMENKDARSFVAACGFIVLVLLMLGYLTWVPVPTGNKDIIVSIISMLVGGLSVSISTILGKSTADTEEKIAHDLARDKELVDLRSEVIELKAAQATLKYEYDKLMRQLVGHLAVVGERDFLDSTVSTPKTAR